MSKDLEGWDYAGTSRDKSVGPAVTEGPGQKQRVRQGRRPCHRPRAWTELEAMGSRGSHLQGSLQSSRCALLRAGKNGKAWKHTGDKKGGKENPQN